MKRRLLQILAIAAALLGPAAGLADDGVVVLPSGATIGVTVLDLTTQNGDVVVTNLGTRRVVPQNLGPQVLNDVKILPDGTHLVSGNDSLGLIVTDEEGEEIFRLTRRASFGEVVSASVGAYFSGAEPSRILVASDTASAAFVRQVSSERLLVFEPTRLGEARGDHAEAIVLPGNKLAVAANFPTLGTSALDVITLSETGTTRQRYADEENINNPEGTVVDTDFETLRDVHGFGGDTPGDLLVVTRRRAFRLAPDGTKAWVVDPGTFETGGEFASGVVLPSGRIALALFEPGRWTSPHPNHRVVWLEPDGTWSGTISDTLEAAPRSIDALDGHGGTGTTGWVAGLDTLPLGDPEALSLAGPPFLSKEVVRRGELIRAAASILYDGANAVALERARLVAAPLASASACRDVEAPVFTFVSDQAVTILAGESYPLAAERDVDGLFDFGRWCVWVEVVDTTGKLTRLGDSSAFDVVRQGGDAGGTPIPSDRLGFGDNGGGDAGADAGSDAGASGGGGGDGCGCASGGSTPAPVALLLLAFMLMRGCKRRRRHRGDQDAS